ncbi:unnamed protein product [Echinostoma caproni]|uniref:Uncharacterized protein n=1 Tax=Echinostoma caproni TaxID=27848 RepID=A0A183A3D2_9TREM|nr:unnamed protein product [Echinostoma caproni]
MSTITRNERIDNYSPTDNPHLARKISTENHVGAVDQRISRYDWVKSVGTARGRGNVRVKCGPKSTVIGPQDEA